MKYSIIDLGSNTIRLVVYQVEGDRIEPVLNLKNFIRTITYVEDGALSKAGITAVAKALKDLASVSHSFKVDYLKCFATASLRLIKNQKEALDEIFRLSGVLPDIISGEDEAKLDFAGMNFGLKLPNTGIAVDIGGGSTEIIHFENGKSKNVISLPYGSLYTYLNFVKAVFPTHKEQEKIRQFVKDGLSQIDWLKDIKADSMFGIGGSARAMAKLHKTIKNTDNDMQGYSLSVKDIHGLCNVVTDRKLEGIRILAKAVPDRINTVIPGMIIFDEISTLVNAKTFTLSRYGVREGYLIEKVIGATLNG